MADRTDINEWNEFRGARPRIFGTNSEDPDTGRIFVWTRNGWFERIEGSLGNVAFTPIANSEAELRELIAQEDPSFDLVELSGEYRKTISEEFMEEAASFEGLSGYSRDMPVEEDDDMG
jgi:hypothetical protein